MNKKLIIWPIIILIIFIISKITLNTFDLEYQSWVYYLILILTAVYILIVSNYYMIKANDKLTAKIFNLFALNFIFLTIFAITFIIALTFYGYDYKIKGKYLRNDTLLQLRPNKELYAYKNFILKSKTPIVQTPIQVNTQYSWCFFER